jgi:hypothetical protein
MYICFVPSRAWILQLKRRTLAFFEGLFKVEFWDAIQTPHLPDFVAIASEEG